jgi:hypothetical protein
MSLDGFEKELGAVHLFWIRISRAPRGAAAFAGRYPALPMLNGLSESKVMTTCDVPISARHEAQFVISVIR